VDHGYGYPAGAPQLRPSRVQDELAVASHEIRQPIAVIVALAEAALVTPGLPTKTQWYLERIVDEAETVSDIVRSTLSVWCDIGDVEQSIEVVGVITDILAAFELVWEGKSSQEGEEHATVHADPVLFRRAVMNLVDNAVRAAGPTGRILTRVDRIRTFVEISVEDDGPGFGLIEGHTNIGLSVAEQLLARTRGTLTVGSSQDLGGARVTLRMPTEG
jgi:signal transduction histidine kinase